MGHPRFFIQQTWATRHGIVCDLNFAVTSDGGLRITGPLLSIQEDNDHIYVGNLEALVKHDADTPIGPGGDAESRECLSVWKFQKPMASGCVDTTVLFWYYLEDQPDRFQGKTFRVSAVLDDQGHYQWSKQNGRSRHSVCEDYHNRLIEKSKQQAGGPRLAR